DRTDARDRGGPAEPAGRGGGTRSRVHGTRSAPGPSAPTGRLRPDSRGPSNPCGRTPRRGRADSCDPYCIWRSRGVSATLVLIRHGEIVRPSFTSNFDQAPLIDRGKEQMRELARAWPADRPVAIFASPLRRSVESAAVLAEAFRESVHERRALKEWSPDESGIPQDAYKALERSCWANLAFVPP